MIGEPLGANIVMISCFIPMLSNGKHFSDIIHMTLTNPIVTRGNIIILNIKTIKERERKQLNWLMCHN